MIFICLSILIICLFLHLGITVNIKITHCLEKADTVTASETTKEDVPDDGIPTAATNLDEVITNINELMGVDDNE